MRKLLTFAVLAVVAAVISAPPAQAINQVTFSYRWEANLCTSQVISNNAYQSGGETVEMWWCPTHRGAIQTNSLAFGSTPHPYSNTGFDTKGNDSGTMASRSAVSCNPAPSDSVHDDPATNFTVGGHAYAIASVWVSAGEAGGGKGAGCFTYAAAKAAIPANATLNIFSFTRVPSALADVPGANGNIGQAAWAVGKSYGAGSMRVTGNHPTGGFPWVRISFPETNFPAQAVPTNGVNGSTVNYRYGFRVLRSELAAGSAKTTDYSVIKGGNGASIRFDGVGAAFGEWGSDGSGEWFITDYSNDGSTINNVGYYALLPVLEPQSDTAWANTNPLGADGIPVLFGGSWIEFGTVSETIGNLPTPVTVSSFTATFDPKTGRVTLNWRTADDTGGSFAIIREVWIGGKLVDSAKQIGVVQSNGVPGSDYKFVDTTLIPGKYAKLAKGQPLDVRYRLEIVSDDGARTGAATASVAVPMPGGKK